MECDFREEKDFWLVNWIRLLFFIELICEKYLWGDFYNSINFMILVVFDLF